MTFSFSTRNFDPLTPLAPKFPNFDVQILLFRMKHCCHSHTCTCRPTTKFLHHLGTGCCLPITTFRTKIGEGWARGTLKNLGPLHISATVKASNFKFGTQLGFGTSLPKNDVLYQNWRGSGPGEHQKNLGPPTYFGNRWQFQIWCTNWVWD